MASSRLARVVLSLGLVVSSTASAAEPSQTYGPVPPPAEPAPSEATPVEATAAEATTAAATPAEPTPAEPTSCPSVAEPPVIVTPDVPHDSDLARAVFTRDAGGSIMIASGAIATIGIVLIFTGTGVATAETRRAGCSDPDLCDLNERKLMHAGRTLVAGFAIAGLGAVGLIAGIAAYASGKSRVDRARGGFGGIVLAPSPRGASLGFRGRF